MDELERVVSAIAAESSAGRSIAEIVEGPTLRDLPLGLALLGLCRTLNLTLEEGRRYFRESPHWERQVASANALQAAIIESIRDEASEFPDVEVDVDPPDRPPGSGATG